MWAIIAAPGGIVVKARHALFALASAFAFAGPAPAQQDPAPLPAGGTNPIAPDIGGMRGAPLKGPVLRGVNPREPAAPTPLQARFEVAGFTTADLACRPDLSGATIRLRGEAAIEPRYPMAVDALRHIVIELDGRLVRTIESPQSRRTIAFDEQVSLAGASGDHQVVFILDGERRRTIPRLRIPPPPKRANI